MNKIIPVVLVLIGILAVTNTSLAGNIPAAYTEELSHLDDNNYKFDDNQIRSFVYYWYGLHDKHVNPEKSIELLDLENLLMVFPEQTVKDAAGYKLWYANVGKNIRNNVHTVKYIDIRYLTAHQYRLRIIVNWQAVDNKGNYIDTDATQEWLLVDGASNSHPYVREYKVIDFRNNLQR